MLEEKKKTSMMPQEIFSHWGKIKRSSLNGYLPSIPDFLGLGTCTAWFERLLLLGGVSSRLLAGSRHGRHLQTDRNGLHEKQIHLKFPESKWTRFWGGIAKSGFSKVSSFRFLNYGCNYYQFHNLSKVMEAQFHRRWNHKKTVRHSAGTTECSAKQLFQHSWEYWIELRFTWVQSD